MVCWEGERRGRNHKKDQDIGGYITLRWAFKRRICVVWTGLVWLRIGTIRAFL
jgi:hypothetical protein